MHHSLTFRNNVLFIHEEKLTFLNTFHSHAAKHTFQNFPLSQTIVSIAKYQNQQKLIS